MSLSRARGVDVPAGVLRQVEEAITGAISATDSGEGSVWIVEGKELRPVLMVGPNAEKYRDTRFPLVPRMARGLKKPRALHLPDVSKLKKVPNPLLLLARAFGVQEERALEVLQNTGSLGVRSIAVVPIHASGKLIGVLSIGSSDRKKYDAGTLRYLRALGRQIGVAMESRQLLEHHEDRLQLLEAYGNANALIAGTVGVDAVLEQIAHSAATLARATDASLYLWDEEEGRLHGVAATGRQREAVLRTPIQLDEESAIAQAFERGQPVIYEDVAAVPCTLPPGRCLACRFDTRALAAMPLVAVGDAVGVLVVSDDRGPRPFAGDELERMHVLADHAAVAIQQAQLARDLEEREQTLRHLSDELIQTHEEERRRVAREIHDGVAQSLAALALEIALADSCLAETNLSAVKTHCMNAFRIREETADAVRRLSDELRPGILDELGLGPALEWHCQEAALRTGLNVEFEGSLPAEIPAAEALALYRAAQEALANAAQHADAERVTVRVDQRDGRLELTVVDDGRGFDPRESRAHRPGIGLLGMRERVRQLDGELHVTSEPGTGTTVRVALPAAPEVAS